MAPAFDNSLPLWWHDVSKPRYHVCFIGMLTRGLTAACMLPLRVWPVSTFSPVG